MRLYTIYKICKQNIDALEQCERNSIYKNGEFVLNIKGWNNVRRSITNLYSIEAFKEVIERIYNDVPIMYRDIDSWELSAKGSMFNRDIDILIHEISGLIRIYESFGYQEKELGIDIKMPPGDFSDFVSSIRTLEYIFTQCPLFKNNDGEIQFSNVDVGSTWLTFFIVGSGAVVLAKNVAEFFSKAITLKSRLNNIEQQEELLRSAQIKNDVLESSVKTFDLLRETTINHILDDLVGTEVENNDHEGRDKTKLALEKMTELIDKGMEIYASIDTPEEIQVLFPEPETGGLLTDNITKLLTTEKTDE